jgi:aryl-alcohol dehydrogenase-like predicted oxidoreductase
LFTKKIIIGSAQFGLKYGISNTKGKTQINEVDEILSFCNLNGIDSIDTAYAYGESEKVLGKLNISNFKIISKFIPQSKSIPSIENQLDTSLKRLKIEYLDAYLAHRPLEVSAADWRLLNKFKAAGKFKKIGFSFNEPWEVDSVIKRGFIPDIIQAPFNYLDNRFEEKLRMLKDNYKVEIHTRSVFLQGLFFTDPNSLSTFFNPLKKELVKISKLDKKAGSLLKFVLSKDYIDKVVVGSNNLKQLEQNINEIEDAPNLDIIFNKNSSSECLIPAKWPIS